MRDKVRQIFSSFAHYCQNAQKNDKIFYVPTLLDSGYIVGVGKVKNDKIFYMPTLFDKAYNKEGKRKIKNAKIFLKSI